MGMATGSSTDIEKPTVTSTTPSIIIAQGTGLASMLERSM